MESLASYQTHDLAPDRLVVNASQILTEKKGLASGVIARGDVVGRIAGEPVAAAAAGNSGNGTIGAVTVGAGVKLGVYTLTCIEPASDAGTFQIEDPDGVVIGRLTVAVAYTGPINLTVADGSNNWVAGDRITVTVPDSGNVAKCVAAATDGSAVPWGIAATAADATDAAQEVLVYTRGDFNANAVALGAGLTLATVKEQLRPRGIALISAMGA